MVKSSPLSLFIIDNGPIPTSLEALQDYSIYLWHQDQVLPLTTYTNFSWLYL